MSRIQVAIAEDQAMVLGALAALLETEPDITVCARATNGRAALAALGTHKPDVLVTDIEMPGDDGPGRWPPRCGTSTRKYRSSS